MDWKEIITQSESSCCTILRIVAFKNFVFIVVVTGGGGVVVMVGSFSLALKEQLYDQISAGSSSLEDAKLYRVSTRVDSFS